jgi:hypothetical protein
LIFIWILNINVLSLYQQTKGGIIMRAFIFGLGFGCTLGTFIFTNHNADLLFAYRFLGIALMILGGFLMLLTSKK